ncbi:hypothetical protein BCV69DRAFT_312129 [Microstroma glucosiphilum]|uniref:DUF833-domain-containing protein n=1 Tax=Pseudomicrostroma glucosiphilum TaxID=1684307 RepID=A0A316U8U3_9BASI|nr:hypothetical protein BCV69DRAFT_312129 [Pseudomicrostroma glucosiphilum]PWN21636.1 hypothetical protein BCV69DRAFT_312129 [Pseudomicrostroma glucosiphilum]
MCCIFFTLGGHDHHLILASNRDEYLQRPTSSAAFHSFPSPSTFVSSSAPAGTSAISPQLSSTPSATHPILSGIDADLSGGGTWLGVHVLSGRWAALTNFTEPAPPALPPKGKPHVLSYRSRGGLVRDWLTADGGTEDMQKYLDRLEQERDEYAGFNLLIGQLPTITGEKRAQLAYATNRNHSQGSEAEPGESDSLPGEVRFLLHPHDEHASSKLEGSQTACLSCEVPSANDHDASDGSRVSSLQPSSLQAAPTNTKVNGLNSGTSTDTDTTSLGLSNSVLSEPWSKVKTGRAGFDEAVQRYASSAAGAAEASSSRQPVGPEYQQGEGRREAEAEEAFIESLFQVLATPGLDQVQERADLRRTVLVPAFSMAPPKGKGKAWYGTRTSTILLVRKSGEVTFVERDVHTMDGGRARLLSEEERRHGQRRYDFKLGAL